MSLGNVNATNLVDAELGETLIIKFGNTATVAAAVWQWRSRRAVQRRSRAAAAETSGFEVMASIIRQEGFLGLWRGTWITMATLA